jgi:hypothetical protein
MLIVVYFINLFLNCVFLCLQAFLEMADECAASTMVTYFTTCVAQLRGRAVYVQFSNHKELKTDQTHSNAVSDHELPACSSKVNFVFTFIIFFLKSIFLLF